MYEIKNRIFSSLTKNQKSSLCAFLRAQVKKYIMYPSPELSDESGEMIEFIFDKFCEDERYYLEIDSSRFPFLAEFIDDENFLKEIKLYLQECQKYYDYKKSQEPLIQAQKQVEKEKRKFFQEVKMSKEPPTKKQISYYKSLCKRYNEDKKDADEFSKLDLRNEIDRILSEHQTDSKTNN